MGQRRTLIGLFAVVIGVAVFLYAIGSKAAAGLEAILGSALTVLATLSSIISPPSPPELADSAEMKWPRLIGHLPGEVSAFQSRPAVRKSIDVARARGAGVALSGGAGVGKSELAASYAQQALAKGADLVLWVNAAQPGAIAQAFAQAARELRVSHLSGSDAEADADRFLAWAAVTPRSWVVVLDDIDPLSVEGWWPKRRRGTGWVQALWWPTRRRGTGWVLATTRRRGAALSEHGIVLVDVGVYEPAEARGYLEGRLAAAGQRSLFDTQADNLATELGFLPLAMAQAAAYMIDRNATSAEYLRLYRSEASRLEEMLPAIANDSGGGDRRAPAALLVGLDGAEQRDPVGLARPAMALAAVLDPAGHPVELWATKAVTEYLTEQRVVLRRTPRTRRPGSEPVTPDQARDVMLLLHRYGLISVDEQAGPRAVRIHALTGRAARETAPVLARSAAQAAADGLVEIWPEGDGATPALAETLRASADALHRYERDALWSPGPHRVLIRAGESLLSAGLHGEAIKFWEQMVEDCKEAIGPDNSETLLAWANLAMSYLHAVRVDEALAINERIAPKLDKALGEDDKQALDVRQNLASCYWRAKRTAEALAIDERVTEAYERKFGPENRLTLTAQANLAVSYRDAGRVDEAIALGQKVIAVREQMPGSEERDTLPARIGLSLSYLRAGKVTEALALSEPTAADCERILGPDHPTTLTAKMYLAQSYQKAGRTRRAILLGKQVAADRERVLGADNPDSIAARQEVGQWSRPVFGIARRPRDRVRLWHESCHVRHESGCR